MKHSHIQKVFGRLGIRFLPPGFWLPDALSASATSLASFYGREIMTMPGDDGQEVDFIRLMTPHPSCGADYSDWWSPAGLLRSLFPPNSWTSLDCGVSIQLRFASHTLIPSIEVSGNFTVCSFTGPEIVSLYLPCWAGYNWVGKPPFLEAIDDWVVSKNILLDWLQEHLPADDAAYLQRKREDQ